MSSMFGGGFKASKCKTLLRLAMARIKLLRNKRDIQIKQMRRDIAQLLSSGQEPSARIRVEHIAREQNIMAAYDIIELFCELIIVRLPIIESQKACPMDLKEAVCSLIFASPRCADLPELLQIRGLFTSKYGKEFVASAAELRPECGVNRRIIEKLSVRAPSGQTKLKLLTEIAAEHNVNWDPADSEAELMKQPEDLLDGHKKFYGASEAPVSLQPSPPKKPEQTAPAVPPAPAPAAAPAPAPPSTREPIQMNALYSSESEEDTPPGEKKQFIPFVGPVPPKGLPAGKGSSSSVSSGKGVPQTQTKEAPTDYEHRGDYNDVAAAAKAAAESADRAVAAARAAAELAKTHPSKREPLSRNSSKEVESSSSEEESEEEEEVVESKSTSGRTNDANRQGKSVSFAERDDSGRYQEKQPDGFYRSSPDGRQDDSSLKRSNSDDYNAGVFARNRRDEEINSFPRAGYSEERPQPEPVKKFDSEKDSFWRSGDQDWRQAANFASERKFDSGGFHSAEQRYPARTDSDLFKGSQATSTTSKLFGGGSDSGRDLFKSGSAEEKVLRSSDEGFATPKFDDEEEVSPFSKPISPVNKPTSLTKDLSFNGETDYQRPTFDSPRSNYDSPKAKPSFKEYWQSSSFSYAGTDDAATPKLYDDGYRPEKQPSDSHTFDTNVSDFHGLSRGSSDPMSTKSYYGGDDPESPMQSSQTEGTPIPKSRRTRRASKGRDSLEGAGGSGGLPPSGRLPKYSSSENFDSARSPEFHTPEADNPPAQSYDDSPNFPPKTSLSFFNSHAATSPPPERTPPSVSSAYESPDTFRESSPPVRANSQSSSPGLERRDSPSAPALHPKLPDYDDLTARFEALKGKTKR